MPAKCCSTAGPLERGYFRPEAVAQLLDEHHAAQFDHGYRLWGLLVFELWQRQWLDDRWHAALTASATARSSRRKGAADSSDAIEPSAMPFSRPCRVDKMHDRLAVNWMHSSTGAAGMNNVLAVVLAGGKGSRLEPLTRDRAKPAVPFGGAYRIIDFTLSNCS